MYIPWIVMFFGFINISYSPSATFIPLLYYQPLPLLENKSVPSPIFWRINKTPIPIPFVKSEGDPAMINQNYLFHIFVTKNRSSKNNNIEFQIWECVIY